MWLNLLKMNKKTITDEIKRLIHLSYQTYKLFGIRHLIKEVIRYLIHGALPVYNSDYNDLNHIDYITTYSTNQIEEILENFQAKPLISIITPVYNVHPAYLDQCIQSVISQHYANWELCLYDDCSIKEETIRCLEKWSNFDKRIKLKRGTENLHISLASNEAIKMSSGQYIGFLDHDDELLPITLLEVVKTINKNPAVGLIYSDEDFISPNGDFFNPHFKSDFNKGLILSHNYITHFMVVEKNLGNRAGWFREGYEGSQDYDLILRLMDMNQQIVHIPKILYHWRQSHESTSLNYEGKSYADQATRKALSDYAQRNGFKAEILNGPGKGVYRLKRELTTKGKVSIIIPFKDQISYLKDCINSLLEKTTYQNFELILISNNSKEKQTFDYLDSLKNKDNRIKIYEYNVPFNFSGINNWAVEKANGEFILLLNNDIKIINEDWLEAMLEHIQQDNVGIVGAKLLYPDKTIQHAGVIIGILGVAGHAHKFFHDSSTGYFYRTSVIQNLSAVTGACLLTKKELWNKVGGLDETNLKIAFNDIDYCLKVKSLGYDIIYTPYAKLYHYESKSRGPENTPEKQQRFVYECQYMVKKWGTDHIPDPFYNINLTLNTENFGIRDIKISDKNTGSLILDQIGDVNISDNFTPLILGNHFNQLLIEGWINFPSLKKDSNLPELIINQKSFPIEYNIRRVDVANATKNNNLLYSGFKTYVPKHSFENGENRISLKLYDENGIPRESNQYTIQYMDCSNIAHTDSTYQIISTLYQNYKNSLKELQDSNFQKNCYQQEVVALKNSWSWLITAPLRWLGALMIMIYQFPRFVISSIRTKNARSLVSFFRNRGQDLNSDQFIADSQYRMFLSKHKPTKKIISQILLDCKNFHYKPLISIIIPVYNVEPAWLKKCIQSVIHQYYPNWELCLYDDASTNKQTLRCLKKYERLDNRIKIKYGTTNLNISLASNEAVKLASGEFIGLLDNDDELTKDALYEVIKKLNENPDFDYIYSDEDKIDQNGKFTQPYFKPDFNLDLFLSNNYLCHFSVIRKSKGDQIGWFRKGYEGSQDYDLFLRLINDKTSICHISKVLYHWRIIPGSTSEVYGNKGYADFASQKALKSFLSQNGIKAEVTKGIWSGSFRISREIPPGAKVSIIIPFKDQSEYLKRCIHSIMQMTTNIPYEIILLNNNSTETKTLDYLEQIKEYPELKIYEYHKPFNFAAINNFGSMFATSDYLLFLNNDTEVISHEWLSALTEHLLRKEVGAVGARLLYSDYTVQHAGVLLGVGGIANHAFFRQSHSDPGYFGNSLSIRNYSAVTGACLMVKKSLFTEIGGFDEKLAYAFNDIDLCLRIREKGFLITYTPYSLLFHHESKSRGYDDSPEKKERLEKESLYMISKWGNLIENDPCYNPNLTTDKMDFSLKV